jgi:hypothetical protein
MRLFQVMCTALSLGLVAATAQAECPEGDWFCEPGSETAPSAPTKPAAEPQPPPDAGDGKGAQPSSLAPPRAQVRIDAGPPPRPRRHRRQREFGANLHIVGALLGSEHGMSHDAGMGGLGAAFRLRLVPMFALDVGLDFLGGRDFNGNVRGEAVLSANGLLYLNPRQRAELYLLGGLSTSRAHVEVRHLGAERVTPHDASYSYFGGQLGFGVEARLSRRLAASADLVGFIRERSRRYRYFEPDFVDPETHRATNRSGGGLIRGGFTFYW